MVTLHTTESGHSVLLLDTIHNIDGDINFVESMFEAVYIISPSSHSVRHILSAINPVISTKCCYKPFFALKSMKGRLGAVEQLIDCFTDDIEGAEAADVMERLLSRQREIGLMRTNDAINTSTLFFIRLMCYFISRNQTLIEPRPEEGSSLGYVIPLFEHFYNQSYFKINDYIFFYQSMMERGYFRAEKFINKVYLCHHCQHSHLLYIEHCPRCGASQIQSEEVIHHFHCANVSPESTYNFGGQLRCPKCHRLLRHIGVDYDRPSLVYTCGECKSVFLEPELYAICTHCGTENTVQNLLSHDVQAFSITDDGQRALLSPHAGFMIYTDFYDNYLMWDNFMHRLSITFNQRKLNQERVDVAIYKVWTLNKEGETTGVRNDIIELICKSFDTCKVSSAYNIVYIKETEYGGDTERHQDFLRRVEAVMGQAARMVNPEDTIFYCYEPFEDGETADFDAYLNNMKFINMEAAEGYRLEPAGA